MPQHAVTTCNKQYAATNVQQQPFQAAGNDYVLHYLLHKSKFKYFTQVFADNVDTAN